MLTIIQTWTCALCGKCETIRAQRLTGNMQVPNFPTPNGWHWLNSECLVCDEHTITIRDKAQPECQT